MAIGKTFIQILGPNEQFPNNPGFPTIFLQKQSDPSRSILGFNDGQGNTFSALLVLQAGGGPGTKLSRIFDVNAPTPADGDTLVFDSGTEKWVNGAGGGGSTASTFSTLFATSLSGGTIYSGNTDLSVTFGTKMDKDISINSQSGGSYTLTLADKTRLLEMATLTGAVLVIPTNASVAFPIGSQVLAYQASAGQITFSGSAGVTLISAGSKNKTATSGSTASLIKVATDSWLLSGDITT